MEVNVVPVSMEEKSVLAQIIELYKYDFSEFDGEDINNYGYYGYKYLDSYWTDNDRKSYFIKVEGKIAGFVLVNTHCFYLNNCFAHSIAEFFVMKKYRRKGIGEVVANNIFNTFPGKWEVCQYSKNIPSQVFWERVIGKYTNNNYKKHSTLEEQKVGITFDNTKGEKSDGDY